MPVPTTYTDTAVTGGISYSYAVSAVNAVGEGSRSNTVSVIPTTVATAPPAPTITVTAGNASATIHWTWPLADGGSPITHLQPFMNGVQIDDLSAPSSLSAGVYTFNNLTNGTSYSFFIRVVNAIGTSPNSNTVSATPVAAATAPSAPVLSGTAGNAQAVLNWTTPANGGSAITGYKVYRGGGLITTLGVVNTYTNTGLTNGTGYNYTVTAINAVGESTQSNTVTLTPSAPVITVPSAPVLSGTASSTQVSLSWTTPSSNGGAAITGYNLYRGGAQLVILGVVTSYNDTGLINGTAYSYSVTAVNSQGQSAQSNTVTLTPSVVSSPTLPANQIVGQPSWKSTSWGGYGYIYAYTALIDSWVPWGFVGQAVFSPATHLGLGMTGSSQLATDVPNTPGSQYADQRSQEGLANGTVGIAGRGSFYNQKTHDPTNETYLKFYTNNQQNTGTYPPFHDWFDDAFWTNTGYPWFAMIGRDVKNLGGSGIGFDTEPADWSKLAPGKTAAQQEQQVFNVAYECARQFYTNFPNGGELSYMWNSPQGGFGHWLRGWYYNGDTRIGTTQIGANATWYFAWLKGMCDFGGPGAKVIHMQADFYSLGEGSAGMNGESNQYNTRLAKLKMQAEGIYACLSQPYPLGLGATSWNNGCDKIYFVPSAWAAGYTTNPRMNPSQWMTMMTCDRVGSIGPYKNTYMGGDAGGLSSTPDSKWYAIAGDSTSAVQGFGTTHNAACVAGADQTPIPTVAPTCTNLSWTGSTISCRAAHQYGVIYVKVYNGAGFDPANPDPNYLGAMQMVWNHPSLPDYVGIAGNAPGGSNPGASAITLAKMADTYQQCTYPTTGNLGDWRVLKVVSAKMDVGWFKVQRTS
jgi:fibronectin type 3 domain-containing protein